MVFGCGLGLSRTAQTKEFEYRGKLGMSPVQAIRAATSEAAQLERVKFVMKGGQVFKNKLK